MIFCNASRRDAVALRNFFIVFWAEITWAAVIGSVSALPWKCTHFRSPPLWVLFKTELSAEIVFSRLQVVFLRWGGFLIRMSFFSSCLIFDRFQSTKVTYRAFSQKKRGFLTLVDLTDTGCYIYFVLYCARLLPWDFWCTIVWLILPKVENLRCNVLFVWEKNLVGENIWFLEAKVFWRFDVVLVYILSFGWFSSPSVFSFLGVIVNWLL